MNKSSKIILTIIIILFSGFFIWRIVDKALNANEVFTVYVDAETLADGATAADPYIKLEPATEANGYLADHVKGGDPATAKVVFIEYADYQCQGCALTNPWVNELLEEYNGDVAVVYRSYFLDYHDKPRLTAATAAAAGFQGYWHEMSDKLFATQSDWYNFNADKFTEQAVEYFEEITDGKGDVEKFKNDIKNENITTKLEFDYNLAKTDGVFRITATPSFFHKGKALNWQESTTKEKFLDYMRNYINKAIAEAERKTTQAQTAEN